ncbi:hypothetical protein BJX64DRAFT_263761 [Aspergillus heterothallicus]
MVGVPAKYGGCTTCRRRKKGCDKKTPFCSQCVEAGLLCEGYTRTHSVWINSTDGAISQYAKPCSIEKTRRRKGRAPADPLTTTTTADPPTITLHDSLARLAREDRYVDLYLAAFLPNGRLFTKQAAQISSAGWLRYYDELCQSEKTLRLITLAHGLSMLATRDSDCQLKLKGLEAHRMALWEMHVALQDPAKATGDGILAAVRLFRFYEILYGAESKGPQQEQNPTHQVNGYYAHTDGEMALFMNRGPSRKWSEAGMYLLVSGRIVSFILGVGRRKRSPFSNSEWMTAPWKHTQKSPLDRLTDILVQIPGLLEMLDTIRTVAPDADRRTGAWIYLLKRCTSIEQMLLAWKTTMATELQTYDYTHYPETTPLPIPKVDRDFALLHMSSLYWSCCILLYTTAHQAATEAEADHPGLLALVASRYPTASFSSPHSPNFHNECNPTLHAHRIIHAMPLSHGRYAGGYGALCSTFPLGMALRYLVVAHCFPHEPRRGDENQDEEGHSCRAFLCSTLAQPFMRAYTARFVGNLHMADNNVSAGRDLGGIPGWKGVEARMRTWWFGCAVGEGGI